MGLGCWPLGGLQMISGQGISYGSVSKKDAVKIIHRALELGINIFDTADSYSLGGSEIILYSPWETNVTIDFKVTSYPV